MHATSTRRHSHARARTRGIAATAGLLIFAYASSAAALHIFVAGAVYPGIPIFAVRCNDGAVFIMPPGIDYGAAYALGTNVHCVNHGGVADVTDTSVQTALAQAIAGGGESTMTIGRDDRGTWVGVTHAELEALAAAAGPQGAELPGHAVLSIVVGGTELLPAPVQLPERLHLAAIWSDDDDGGDPVGGQTSATVPLGGLLGVTLAGAFAGAGVTAIRRRSRREPSD